jgi:LTXXQ motif family protein
MSTSTRKWFFVSALLATAATASMALAQDQQQMPMTGHHMMGGQGMMGQHMMGGQGMMCHHMMGSQGMMGHGTTGPGMMCGCPMMRSGMMGPGKDMQHGMGMAMQPGIGMGGMMGPGGMMQPFLDANLAYTKALLKITDAQEVAWTDYVIALKAYSQATLDLQQKMRTQTGQTMPSTVERIDLHAQIMEEHLNALKALKPATEALYKFLTHEQQQMANVFLSSMCCTM